jgi:glycerol-3-phosphate dehydrogenase
MAKEVCDRAVEWLNDHAGDWQVGRTIRRCRTKHRPLPGAQGLELPGQKAIQALAAALVEGRGLEPRVAEHLSQTYGVRAALLSERGSAERIVPDLPYLWSEVDHAVELDLARTIEDVLVRRIPLCLRGRDQGLDVAARVAERIGPRLGWSETETQRQLGSYSAYVATTRRFRQS